MKLSGRVQSIHPSITLSISARAKQMAAEGIDVVGFGAGEPDFDTPVHIRDAAKEALDRGMTRYTPAEGMLDLRKAIAEKFERENGLRYEPSQIVVSNGAKQSLFNAFMAILDPGDEVLIPSPYWVSYPELVSLAGGVPVLVPTDESEGFRIDAGRLAQAVTPGTRAIVINNPCNPTGAVYSRENLAEIARLAADRDLVVISDEIYEKLCYTPGPAVSIAALGPDMIERTIVINGASKAFAMTGWRIGYAAAPLPVAKAMGGLQSHITSNPNSMAQYAAARALRGPQESVLAMAAEFRRRRDYIADRIGSIPGLSCVRPDGAFYVMMNIGGAIGRRWQGRLIAGSMDFCEALLEAQKVAVVPGCAFGSDRHVRLSYAASMNDIERGMDRISAFMSHLD